MRKTISKNCLVSFHYTLKDDEGNILSASGGTTPFYYIHGTNNLIPGLENELTGKIAGDNFKVSVSPADAYGGYKKDLVQIVPISMFEELGEVKSGMQFQTWSPNGPHRIVVTHVKDGEVTIDTNHPLAGKTLHFKGSIESIRDATSGEQKFKFYH